MQLKALEYHFPANAGECEVSETLLRILSFHPGSRATANEVELAASFSSAALPTTKFIRAHIDEPRLCFRGTSLPDVKLQGKGVRLQEWLRAEPVDIRGVAEILKGHVLWVDHTGLNVPASLIAGSWQDYVRTLGDQSLLYAYPSGEPWFFALPGTVAEYRAEIVGFPVGRCPRFELVEAPPEAALAVQIDIQTDIARPDLERSFPFPLSACLPGLEAHFLSVFIRNPWPDLELRIDLRPGPGQKEGDHETGKWLVEQGRRCNKDTESIPRAVPRKPCLEEVLKDD